MLQEVEDKFAGDCIVELLLFRGINVIVFRPGLNQLGQGVFVDVVVNLGLHQLVVKEIALGSSS